MLEVQKLFRQRFNCPPVHVVQAPGRLELLGNHTDYNEGLVLSLAIDRYLWIAASPRKDGRIEIVTSAFAEGEKFWLDDFSKNPSNPWADYVKGVLAQLRQRGVNFSGFTAAIHSTISVGAGMGSSAALLVATALAVRRLYPFTLVESGLATPPSRNKKGELPALGQTEKLELAKLCHAAETRFVGLNCGLLDYISSLFGKAYHAMEIDCRLLTIQLVPMIGEIAIVVCNSGVNHELTGSAYNQLRQNCEAAARILGAKSLRSVEAKDLAANKARLSERQYQCAYHIVGEIQRVVFGERALRDANFAQFGHYMFQSHESSRDFFKNSCPELDLLVELARTHRACLGARLTGGGFGGATINLVSRLEAEDFMKSVAERYERKASHRIEPMLCQIVDGAS